jgi:hypothetical protein
VFGLLDSNKLRSKDIDPKTNQPIPRGLESKMPTNTNANKTKTTNGHQAESNGEKAVGYVRQTAERTVDVPVGAALIVADRVNEAVEPFRTRQAATRELRSARKRVQRELNKFERRGSTARRRTVQRARSTRNRVERELKARRRRVETTVKENRTKAEDGLKRAQTAVQERVNTLV